MREYLLEKDQSFGTVDTRLQNKNLPIIYRLTSQKGGGRVYFTQEKKGGEIKIYNSGTTLIDVYKDANGEQALHKWKVGLINEGRNPNEVVKERQDYGTILHLIYGNLLQGVTIDISKIKDFIVDLYKDLNMRKSYLETIANNNEEEFQKDILAFLAWIKEYNIKPLAIELMLKSEKWKTATALDLVCEATIPTKGFWGETYKSGSKKGESKETKKDITSIILVDFKSGKKGFYDKNILQLLLSKEIFKENYPDIELGGLYNFAPSDWKTAPSFRFTNQEQGEDAVGAKHRGYLNKISTKIFELGLIKFEESTLNRTVRHYRGVVDLGSDYDISEFYEYLKYKDLAKNYLEKEK